jgi:serine phosphatase RsbU (regulator of sigma subunit)
MRQLLLVGDPLTPFAPSLTGSASFEGFMVNSLPVALGQALAPTLAASPWPSPPDVVVLSARSLLAQPQLSAASSVVGSLKHSLHQHVLALRSLPALSQSVLVLVADNHNLAALYEHDIHSLTDAVLPLPQHDVALQTAALHTHLALFLQQQQQLWASNQMNDQLSAMNSELYDRNVLIENELYGARQMQQGLLPLALPDDDYPLRSESESNEANTERGFRFCQLHYRDTQLKVSGLYLPCDALGGDLYDVVKFKDDSLGVTMADVSGHGVPAGFITALFKSSFYRMTHAYQRPDEILYHLNNEMAALIKTGDYITGLYCRFVDDGSRIQFAGAGHPYPMLYRARTGEVELLEENGPPLVWMPGMAYNMIETPFEPGDKLLLYTDGITEMQAPNDELFGEERLIALFKTLAEASNKERQYLPLLDLTLRHMSDYTQGRPLGDDLSMVLVEHHG